MFVFATIFAIVETIYFGNNLFPMSTTEMVCDSIAIVISSISVVIMSKPYIESWRKRM